MKCQFYFYGRGDFSELIISQLSVNCLQWHQRRGFVVWGLWNENARFAQTFFRHFLGGVWSGKSNGGCFRKGGFSNNRFVLKPDVAIASEVSILSMNSLAITDFHAKKTQHVQLFENPLPGTPAHSRFSPNLGHDVK